MGTSNTTEDPPETPTEADSKVIDFYAIKVARLGDKELLDDCMLFLRALQDGLLTPENKIRATTLFTEATTRDNLEFVRLDFLTALRVIKHL